jgi:hypothetical protein
MPYQEMGKSGSRGEQGGSRPEVLMFDVPPPFLSRGLDAYMATWGTFFSRSRSQSVLTFTT